jgi:uncharacterized protein YcaQ
MFPVRYIWGVKLEELRSRAVTQTLFAPTTLKAALRRLEFVQADPIRAPARAQDLILRHRVNGYRAGDLERRYPSLEIEEDLLYAYGFMGREVWRLLHPRKATRATELERRVLELVRLKGAMHPGELEGHFGRRRVVNAWGGYSKATKDALEKLHHRGLLRIARRENGIRVYEPAPPLPDQLTPKERLRQLVMVVARVLGPAQKRTLSSVAAYLHRKVPNSGSAVADLLKSGELEEAAIDGVVYVWPRAPKTEAPAQVRFLAPFDPVVWDRRRFEHLWGWSYRFEAYTPKAKRVRGYYALPLLWRDRVVGWVNAGEKLEFGYVARPREREFERELEAEVERLRIFLQTV